MNLSYSLLRTYTNCPLQYRYTYIDRLPRAPRGNLQLAKKIHVALRHYFLYAEYGPPDFQKIAEAYADAWETRIHREVVETAAYQDGLKVLRGYYEATRGEIQRPVMVEQRFRLEVGRHTIAGKIDRVDLDENGQLEVIDYKLDRELPSLEDLNQDIQLGLYLLAVEELQGRAPEAASRYYLRHNKKISVVKTSDEIERVAVSMADLGDRIERDNAFCPTPGKACVGCSYRKQCPAVVRSTGKTAVKAALEAVEASETRWVQGQPSLANVGSSYITPEIPGL